MESWPDGEDGSDNHFVPSEGVTNEVIEPMPTVFDGQVLHPGVRSFPDATIDESMTNNTFTDEDTTWTFDTVLTIAAQEDGKSSLYSAAAPIARGDRALHLPRKIQI